MENLIEKIIILSPSIIAIILFVYFAKLFIMLKNYLTLKSKYYQLKIEELEKSNFQKQS